MYNNDSKCDVDYLIGLCIVQKLYVMGISAMILFWYAIKKLLKLEYNFAMSCNGHSISVSGQDYKYE